MGEATQPNNTDKVSEALSTIVTEINRKCVNSTYASIIKDYRGKWIVAEGPAGNVNSHYVVNIRVFDSIGDMWKFYRQKFYKDRTLENTYAYMIGSREIIGLERIFPLPTVLAVAYRCTKRKNANNSTSSNGSNSIDDLVA